MQIEKCSLPEWFELFLDEKYSNNFKFTQVSLGFASKQEVYMFF